jgi:hypothetical protein
VGPRADLEAVVKRKIPSPCRDWNPRSSSPVLVILIDKNISVTTNHKKSQDAHRHAILTGFSPRFLSYLQENCGILFKKYGTTISFHALPNSSCVIIVPHDAEQSVLLGTRHKINH